MARSERPREPKGNRPHPSPAAFIRVAPKAIPLAFRLGLEIIRIRRKARKAGRIFERELIANGIDKRTASRLKDEYLKSTHIFKRYEHSHDS